MSTYISQGTISVHCSIRKNSPKTRLIFVPSNDYSVKKENKTFAVFVSQSGNKNIIKKCKQDKGNGVKINVAKKKDCREAIISGAAWKQIKVEVMVNKKKELTGIIVPAK